MKILNFGSLNIDYVYSVDHFVRGGETTASLGRDQFGGGKGLNQSIALSKSNAAVWHAGSVGAEDSDFLLELLSGAGVHVEYIRKVQGPSGHAIIQRDQSGQNCILLYGGANQMNDREYIDSVLQNFDSGDFILLQNEINNIEYIMEQSYQKGMKIVFNPSPVDDKLKGYPLAYVDYLILNEIEAAELCAAEGSPDELLELLLAKYPKAKIVLTLGSEGSVYAEKEERIHQGIYPVKAVDTTAAGDTFTGYFISCMSRGEKPSLALDLAARASAIAVSKAGAGVSIPSWDEVQQYQKVH